MVCSLGGGQMTTLLEGGGNTNTSQIMAEDVGCWKLAAQYIQRELKEADEVNLLDEEDMHVFGLRPMVDPLILVCCNSCRKPVKASQYATHAEICKSLSSLVTETDVVAGPKKPPRKERKKIQINVSTQVAPVGKHEKSTVAKTAASNSHRDNKTLKATSFPIQTKKGREFPNESKARSLKTSDSVTTHQTPRKLNDQHSQTKGMSSVAAPLASKIYYSQRNQRLRSAISHMYYRSSSSTSSSTQHDYDNGLSNMVENCDQIPAKSSESLSEESRMSVPTNFLDQFHVNNALGPQTTPVGNLATHNTLPNPYPFDEN